MRSGCGGSGRNDWIERRREAGNRFRGIRPVNGNPTCFPAVAGMASRLVTDNRRLGAGGLVNSE